MRKIRGDSAAVPRRGDERSGDCPKREGVALDGGRVHPSGQLAGGHLTAMALAHDWTAEGLPADIIKGAIPVTGVFDCEPVPDTTVNEQVRLDREAARRLNPLRNPPRRALPVRVAVGGAEPPLWIEMSKD